MTIITLTFISNSFKVKTVKENSPAAAPVTKLSKTIVSVRLGFYDASTGHIYLVLNHSIQFKP